MTTSLAVHHDKFRKDGELTAIDIPSHHSVYGHARIGKYTLTQPQLLGIWSPADFV